MSPDWDTCRRRKWRSLPIGGKWPSFSARVLGASADCCSCPIPYCWSRDDYARICPSGSMSGWDSTPASTQTAPINDKSSQRSLLEYGNFLSVSLYFSLFLSISLCFSLFISVYLCFSLFLCQFCKTQLPQFRWGWQRRQLQRQTLGILATWLIRFCLSPSSFLFLFLFRVNSLRYGAPLDSIFLPQLQLSEWNKLAELDPPVLIQPAPGSTFLITKHPADTQADK